MTHDRPSSPTAAATPPPAVNESSLNAEKPLPDVPIPSLAVDNTDSVAAVATPAAAVASGESASKRDVGLSPADQEDVSTSLLKFADVPSRLSHLSFTPVSTDPSSHSYIHAADAPDPNSSSLAFFSTTETSKDITTSPSSTIAPATSPASATSHTSASSRAPPSPLPPSAIRKTSPGLAARLKALGFGSGKPSTPPATPQYEHIGRLDEEQLRQLDEKHQASSIRSVISRRGRPWKGAGAFSSSKSTIVDPAQESLFIEPGEASPVSSLLPEIITPDPLDMDTQKYRLPDHTNGNGTKVALEMRREHIERNTEPSSPDDDATAPPPTPPPKDDAPSSAPTPSTPPSDFVPNLSTYFTPGHNRPGSIYTLSRVSFANQLAQLTALQLPDAELLSNHVTAMPTAQVAAKALINAAEQIMSWIYKASEVVDGLDSEDDVEWAAAGGREGLAEVENAIARFEELVNAYIGAIEQLQSREDVASVPASDLNRAVSQMESVMQEWGKIRRSLQVVRVQVEIAMEWEELWNNVLGDIQGEMDELSRLVFEMEERRHKSLMAAASGDGVDIGDLETIVEETHPPASRLQAGSRFSLPAFPASPSSPGVPTLSQEDSSLLALFARLQPLRASLEFLPMRLSVFETRAEHSFPNACEELKKCHEDLDARYKKLEKDAESLRKELGEDRWVIVFRGVGRQAQKTHESVEKSLLKLKEAIDSGAHLTNQPVMVKKLENYEAKKTHYGPAVERVLSIIEKGVKDRLTVNGEILRLHADLQAKWSSLKQQMKEMDATLEEIYADKGQQLRDSISSMLSNDRSTIGSGHDTPGSSPPSSIIMSALGADPHTPTSKPAARVRPMYAAGSRAYPENRRHSSLPTPTSQITRKPGFSRLSTASSSSSKNPPNQIARPTSTVPHRPRWNVSTNSSGVDTGHNFKPLSLTTPSPYAKRTPTSQRSGSAITPGSGSGSGSKLPTLRSPVARAASESPRVDDTPTRTGHSKLSFRERISSPGPYSQQALSKPRLTNRSSMAALTSGRRSSLQVTAGRDDDGRPCRPASSLASTSTSRRSSVLPPRTRESSETGRASPHAVAGARSAMRKNSLSEPKDNKPRWRF